MKKTVKWILVILSVTIAICGAFIIGTKFGFHVGQTSERWESGIIKRISQNDTSKLTIEEYRSIWEADGFDPELYAKAAFAILSGNENTNIYLTPGNVIQILGVPSGSNVNGYQGADASRINLWFKNDQVSLAFSMRGPLESVVYEVAPQSRTGWGLSDNYPTSIPESEWPVTSGVFNQTAPPVLVSKAESFAIEFQTESEWFPIIMKHFKDYPPPETPEGLDVPCKSQIMLIDGLRDDLVRITFSIKGKHEYWCDTWWHLEDNQWLRLPPHEGAKLIVVKQ